ncbi:trimeric intracellular cation channel family protein [Amaricoccus tamworthensis]|uniref:trimeric intracellular cation channel family protein n=1 Tax=Amaricoccus tamworthensis TaxID=57002 RepID=UPI003C7B45A8
MSLAQFLDFASVFVFALTGALVASRAQLDFIGFLFFACLTAIGGGTVRDLVLDRGAVFWVQNPAYVGVACTAAVIVYFLAHRLESRYRAIIWLDALALAVAVTAGAEIARELPASWPVILMMGVTTGCLGGLMRDVVGNEVPLVLKQGELYVTAAFAGALGNVVVFSLTGSEFLAVIACVAITLALRAGSILFGWSLPTYRSFPPRQ